MASAPTKSAWRVLAQLVAMLASTGVPAVAQPIFSYFSIAPGTAPIVLTAPHGGTLSYPFPERSCTGSQVCLLDTNTRQLAQATSDEFFDLTGLRPYVVIALGHRRYMDLNRSAAEAYVDPAAAQFYDFYHDAIDSFIGDIREKHGRGLLIDLHGQSDVPDQVLRGTKNGVSVAEMLGVWGEDAFNGPDSLMGGLAAEGLDVNPSLALPLSAQVEDPRFDGGNTVVAYGSNAAGGIDSIQLEFGIDYRAGSAWEQTAVDLAAAMATYHTAYLQDTILAGDYNSDGVVDAADYVTWRDAVGASPGSLPNGVEAGPIGPAHYASWAEHYGDRSQVGTPVPAPTAVAIVASAVLSGWRLSGPKSRVTPS